MRVKDVRMLTAAAAAILVSALIACPALAAPGFTGATTISGTGDVNVGAVAPTPDGGTIVGGYFTGSVTFGTTPALTSAGQEDVFVARRSADGTYRWAHRIGGAPGDGFGGAVATPDGSVYVVGTIGPAVHATGFITKLSADGAEVWARSVWSPLADPGSASVVKAGVSGVSALPDGGVVAVGSIATDHSAASGLLPAGCQCANFGDLPSTIDQTVTGAGSSTAWAARINSAGTFAWATSLGGTAQTTGNAIAALPDGRVAVGGDFKDTGQFGAFLLTSASATSFANGFVARLGAADGTVAAATAISATDASDVSALAASPTGDLLVGGSLRGSASFGGGPALARSTDSAFAALQRPNGTFAWGTAAEPVGTNDTYAKSVTLRSDGTALLTGTIYEYDGSGTRFGDTTLVGPSDDSSAFVAGVSADGRFRWAAAGGAAPHGQTETYGLESRPDGTGLMAVNLYAGGGDATFGAARVAGGAHETSGLVDLLDVPVAPAAPTATAGDGRATVAIAPIAGSAITGYTVTASPGGRTCAIASTATTCTVDGLTNGTAYTFTATAENAAGTSAASAASAAVTPAKATSSAPRLTRAPRIVRTGSSVSLVTSVRVGAAGTLAQRATYTAKARAARASTACTAQVKANKAGTVTITCKLNAKARAALRRGALRLTLTTTFTETGKLAASTTRRVTVPRTTPSATASHGVLG